MSRLTDDDFHAARNYLRGTAGLVFDESRRAGLSGVVADRLRVDRLPRTSPATSTSLTGPEARPSGSGCSTA